MNRAYSILDIKSFDNDQRIIEGIASTPMPDRVGDVVVPTGAKFKLPMPLLWQHRASEPIGEVLFAEATDAGIPFKARIAKSLEPGKLKDRLDEAWQSIKLGLVKAVSIGFRVLDGEPIDKKDPWGGQKFNSWEWLELSAVTIPANSDCSINVIRSIDGQLLAALGNEQFAVSPSGVSEIESIKANPPGASGQRKPVKVVERKPMAKQTIAEQIGGFENTRAAKAARMKTLMDEAAEKNETLGTAEQEEYDGLERELEEVDKHLVRLRKLEKANIEAAKPVDNGSGSVEIPTARSGIPAIQMRANRPAGIGMARVALALIGSHKFRRDPAVIAREQWPSDPEIENFFTKTAVAAGTTTLSGWASQLVVATNVASEFVEYLRPLSLIGRIPGFRRVPFNISIPTQTAGTAGQWVGEGKAKPVGRLTTNQVTLRWAKCACMVVFSQELARFSNPSVEALVRDDLANGISQFLDEQMFDPAVTEVSNVSPASITNGVDTAAASGDTIAAVTSDVQAAFANFLAAEVPLEGCVWVMQANQAVQLSMMMNALGQPAYPGISVSGGTWFGLPVYISTNVGSGRIIIFKPGECLVADDGGVNIDVSQEASLQLDDDPTAGAQSLVSLWQTNQIALRAERFITWKMRRADAIYYITSANYGANGTS